MGGFSFKMPKINKSLDLFSGSYGESKSMGLQGPEAAMKDPGGGMLAGFPVDPGLEKYSWYGLYEQNVLDPARAASNKRKAARAAAAKKEALRPKTKAQEGVIDYTKLQKTLKQMQGVKGKAISPDIMQNLLSGAVQGQIQPAIAREERAMDRAIQKERTDIAAEQHKQTLKDEQRQAEMGFAGDVLGVVGSFAKSVLCTELNRQGLLSKKIVDLANLYRKNHVDIAAYEGYLMWASPLARLMAVSPLVTKFVCSFWKPVTYELASRVSKRKGSLFGKIVYNILAPFSRLVYFLNQKEVFQWVAR